MSLQPSRCGTLLMVCVSLVSIWPARGAHAQPVPRFEPGPCPFEGERWVEDAGIDCGALFVRENRDRSDGRTLRLSVAILRSRAAAARPDPVVFLSGGPGDAVVRDARAFVQSPVVQAIRARQGRDFILWDQRGTGYSDPAFCPDLVPEMFAVQLRPLADGERAREAARLARACRTRMEAEGVDFASYNSVTSARDLDDLRQALGVSEWNVLGVSYGARLALFAARDAAAGIRSLILDSVSPTSLSGGDYTIVNFARSLDLVFQQCARDPACQRAFPELEMQFEAALDSLAADPLVVPVPVSERFPDGRVVLTDRTLELGLFQGMYSRQFIPLVPLAIRELGARNADLVAALADALAPDPAAENPWLHHAVQCYEQAPLRSARIAAEARARHPRLAAIDDVVFDSVCVALHGARDDTTLLRLPITARIPALVAAGEFDPITPPAYGREVARHLPESQYVEVRGMGHGVLPRTPCTRNLLLEFLDAPARPLDTSCLDSIPAVSFLTDVHVVPSVGRAARRLAGGPGIGLLAWSGATALVLASAIVGWPLAALVRRLRKRAALPRDGRRVARGVAWLAAFLAFGFAVGLALVVRTTMDRNPFVLGFGIPGPAAPLLSIPWVVVGLTIAVIGFVPLAWRRGWWGRSARAHYTLVAAACLSVLALLLRLGGA